jgi:hypothetical protein
VPHPYAQRTGGNEDVRTTSTLTTHPPGRVARSPPTGPATSWVPRSSRLHRDQRGIRRTHEPTTHLHPPHASSGHGFSRAAKPRATRFRSAEGRSEAKRND